MAETERILRKRHVDSGGIDSKNGGKEEEKPLCEEEEEEDTYLSVGREVCLPYLCAGLGMVGAGIVLDRVQYWTVFVTIPELFIMVPALIGLKGNLEMTLASRLSTNANLGNLDTMEQTINMGGANLALIQVQGIIVGGLAALIAIFISVFSGSCTLQMEKSLVMIASSVVTASLASFSLGLVMILVIIVARRYRVNPDNVATPIAAALGDLVTLGLLSVVATCLSSSSLSTLLALSILVSYCCLALYCWRRAELFPDTRAILVTGWTPVLSAMVISSMGGTILNRVITRFPDIAVFQPVINGVAGNLVGIQASRLSTELHRTSVLGVLPRGVSVCSVLAPNQTFGSSTCSKMETRSGTAARVLLFLVIPGHLTFNVAIGISQGFQILSLSFLLLYLLAALVQVGLLLHIANVMVHSMWKRSVDPDNSAIPYLTALGDLLGGALLSLVFHLLY